MNLVRVALIALTVGACSFIVYSLLFAIVGILIIGSQNNNHSLLIQRDLAGVPFFLYALMASVPIALVESVLLAAHLLVGIMLRINLVLAVGLATLLTILQVGSLIFILVKFYGLPTDLLSGQRVLLGLIVFGIFVCNFSVLYAGVSVCKK